MFQVYVANISSTLDICYIQMFHVSEVCSTSHGSTWGLTDEGVLVLIPTLESRPRVERGAVLLGRSHEHYDKSRVRVQGVARRTGMGCTGVHTHISPECAGASHAQNHTLVRLYLLRLAIQYI
jgi:hypothetical protein